LAVTKDGRLVYARGFEQDGPLEAVRPGDQERRGAGRQAAVPLGIPVRAGLGTDGPATDVIVGGRPALLETGRPRRPRQHRVDAGLTEERGSGVLVDASATRTSSIAEAIQPPFSSMVSMHSTP